jgi:peptidoglycan/xylan/chitin deacetylase (PgdA/CDA1 family)
MIAPVDLIGRLGTLLPPTRARRLAVLIYHRVLSVRDPMFPNEVTAADFDAQMSAISRYCSPLPLGEAVERLGHGELPPRAVCVTFDDGYGDNEAVALPILLKHGVPATFFIASGFLDGGRMWNDTVVESIRRWPGDELDASDAGLGRLSLADDRLRGDAASALLRAIKHRPLSERDELAARFAQGVDEPLPNDLMMTSLQVRQLHDAGMEIGAHTRSHPILRLLDEHDSRKQVADSVSQLERIIAAPVRGFAYPNGRPGDDYERRHRDLIESMGFAYAVSTARGVADRESDIFELPRFSSWDRSPAKWLGRLLLQFGRH